ncbi:hypothetical protein MSSD14B_41330 [Marinobacter salsuginis]|uniref:Uncharacterized protein n=1 Tax=Marinobacter salsuginis TaxID=418719 RepID=A0A5M3Q5P9_9GAMM|nr:hypothetical protein MSSD14B_41330 [Marinobacter salsuginis]
MGGSLAPVRVAGFTWNGWQPSAVYAGIGRITQKAKPVREVLIGGKPLLQHELKCPGIAENSDSLDCSEYVALVDWIKAVEREDARWKPKSGLFTSQLVRASLDGQPATIEFLEAEFSVNFDALLS